MGPGQAPLVAEVFQALAATLDMCAVSLLMERSMSGGAVQMSVQPPKPMRTGEYPGSRAILALIFGILGLVSMGLFSIPAWLLGKAERRAIEMGASPESGRGMAEAGYILGIIGIVLLILGAVFVLGWIALILYAIFGQ